jgi:predicted AAA+ superfamily ATPase
VTITIPRHVTRDAHAVLAQFLVEEPAVLLEGPRGSGKSTLLRDVVAGSANTRLLDLDDDATVEVVARDPDTALSHDGLVVIDEFQRAPAVLRVVKRAVDRDPEPGRFLLAGSVSAPLLPTGSETLTGRVHRMVLPTLAAGEILAGSARLSTPEPPNVVSSLSRPEYFDLVTAGGYPGALRRPTTTLQRRWLASYLASVADRDIPEATEVRHPGVLPRLYRLIAEQTSQVVGRSVIGQQLGLAPATSAAYVELLRHVHLVRELPGWTVGLSAKVGRRPKVHVADTGLGAAAIELESARLASGALAGAFMESFVLAELAQQASLVEEPLTLAHFRDRSGVEVDIVAERPNGEVIGFEVKSATSVNRADGKGLRFLRDRLGARFRVGIVFYTGTVTGRLDERIWATPIGALWGG